jgi:hypothetical protein
MFRRLWSRRREDDGVALMMAVAVTAMSGVLIVTLIGLAMRETNQTSHNRGRATAVTTAEGAVDAALAAIQGMDVSTLPCGGTTTSAASAPENVTITTTISYLTSAGAQLACPPPDTTAASQVFIKAVATSTPRGGGLKVRREFETLAALKPKWSTDLNKAIFGNSGITVNNNFDLYGQNGPDADVYTNGNFSCANNEHLRGSVVAPQGTISLTNSCTIDVNAYARDGVTMSNGIVNGDIKVSAGAVNKTGGTLVGKAYATVGSAWCTANPTKCTVQSPVKIPTIQTFPVLNGDAATIAQYTAAGYTLVTLTECDPKLVGSVGRWLEDSAAAATTPVLLKTPCRAQIQNNAKTVSLANDIAIFADQGVEITNSVTIQSTSAGVKHQVLFIHPADFQTRVASVACNNNTLGLSNATMNTGIALSNLVVTTSDITQFYYSPCNIDKANQSTVYGQVYSGQQAIIDNKTDAYYVPCSVIGVTTTKVVEYYTADILYKRESTG